MPIRGFARSFASSQQRKGVLRDLSVLGGLIEEEHTTAVAPTDLRRARNVARRGRTTGTRPGVSMADPDYDAAFGSGTYIHGIYEFRRNRDADRDLLVVHNGNVYTAHDATALDKATNSVQITAGQNNIWTFDTFQNKVFAAGGKDSATVDSIWYWDGTNPLGNLGASMTAAGNGLAGGAKYVFSKWNFLFLGGLNGTSNSDNPLVGRYCDWGTDATDGANWPTSNVIPGQLFGENFGPGSYGREFNTGFGSFQDNRNDFLLFLTNRRIVSFAPNTNASGMADAFIMGDSIDTGCVHQNAFVNLGVDVGDAVYIGPDGIHSLVQSQDYGNRSNAYLSWPIRRTWDSIVRNRLKYASGAYWPNEGIVLFLVSTGSSTTHNLILCLDIKDAERITPDTVRWYKWDLAGITPNLIVPCRGEDDKPYIYVGDSAGRLLRFGRTVYADNGAGIPVELETANSDMGIPNQQKTIGDTFVAIQGAGSSPIRHQYILNDGQNGGQSTLLETAGGGAVYGTSTYGGSEYGSDLSVERHRISGSGTSITIGHRFTHAGVSEPFWVTALTQEVFVSGPAADAAANTAAA